MNKLLVIGTVVVGLAAGVGVAMLFNSSSTEHSGEPTAKKKSEQRLTEVDRALPEFTLASIDGSQWNADTLKGKPWVINFWATWCPPCVEEIPSMNAAYKVLEPQGFGMLAINAAEGEEAVTAFLDKIAIDFPNVLGDTNTLTNWSVKALPTTIVVTAEGDVVFQALGPREWDDAALLQKIVDAM